MWVLIQRLMYISTLWLAPHALIKKKVTTPSEKKKHEPREYKKKKKKKNTYIYIVLINGHIITRNTIRFYVFWGIKYGSAHVNRAGTIKVGKGVYAPD